MSIKIAFLQETSNQNVGVMSLSAVLKSQGHNSELFIEPFEKNILEKVESYKPQIVAFSVITGAHQWVLNTAAKVKKIMPEAVVILGGPHPTYFPDIINEPFVDIIARGEAEISFRDLTNRLENGQDYTDTLGLWVKKDGQIFRNDVAALVDDISSLPFPDHGLYLKYPFYRNQSEVPFNTTRGCPFRCSFCYNHVKAMLYKGKGRFVRMRQVDNVISEMESVRSLYPKMRSVILYDDIIGIDKGWIEDFSKAYASRINMPWFTSIRADLVDDFLVDHLSKTNCFCLSLGVETGDENLREAVLGKRIPDSQYINAARLIRNAKIKLRTSNMLFLPGENIDMAFKTIDLNRQMEVDFAWAYTLQPYPGTNIYEFAVKNGFLSAAFQFDDIDPMGLLKPIIQLKDQKKILVLHRMFHFAVHNKIMRKILNFLVLLPPNPLFDALYCLSLILSYAEYHQVSFLRAFLVAWTNYWGTKRKRQ